MKLKMRCIKSVLKILSIFCCCVNVATAESVIKVPDFDRSNNSTNNVINNSGLSSNSGDARIVGETGSEASSLIQRLLIVRSGDGPVYKVVERSFRAELNRHIDLSLINLINIKSITVDSTAILDSALFFTGDSSNETSNTQANKLTSTKPFSVQSDKKDNDSSSLGKLLPLQKRHYDLIITIGTRAAYDVLSRFPSSPVLSVLIPRQTYHTIVDEMAGLSQKFFTQKSVSQQGSKRNEKESYFARGSLSAIYLDQPDERFVLLAKVIDGLSGNNQEPKISLFTGLVKPSLLKARQCNIKSDAINGQRIMAGINIHQGLLSSQYLKRELMRSNVIIATPQLVKQSPNVIKWLLYMAYQRNVPVVGYSQAFVDAGAIASVFSTPEDIGKQAAEVFIHQRHRAEKNRVTPIKLNDRHNKTPVIASVFPRYFQVSLNHSVADALGYIGLSEARLHQALLESALNCKENYSPAPSNQVDRQLTRR